MPFHGIRLKRVFRLDRRARKLRICRLLWQRGVVGLPGGGYSAKLSLSAVAKLIGWSTDWNEWRLTLCGLQLHYLRSHGGIIP